MSNTAEEIANKNKPISFQWEFDNTNALDKEISIPDWILESMEEHAAQRLTTVKEKVENLPKSESIQTVLSIIEAELQ